LHTITAFTIVSSNAVRSNSIPKVRRENRATPKTALHTQAPSSSDNDGIIPQSGDIACINYSLTPNDDFVPTPLFDVGDDIRFVVNGGNYLPAIHTLISTLKVGQSTTDISMDAGWGSKRPELIATIPKETEGDGPDYNAIQVGNELYLSDGSKCRVTHVTDNDFTIDANPPLAGALYKGSITLVSVETKPSKEKYRYVPEGVPNDGPYEVMTIALGCFWGGELEYMRMPGVVGTAVGYTQGATKPNPPTYEEVCSGTTGHTEAIQLIYDPQTVSYESLVKSGIERLGESRNLLNQAGNDRGTQYRHGVYYHNDAQKKAAMDIIASYGDACVTECLPAEIFYNAEVYHQQYLLKGGQSARTDAKDAIRCYG